MGGTELADDEEDYSTHDDFVLSSRTSQDGYASRLRPSTLDQDGLRGFSPLVTRRVGPDGKSAPAALPAYVSADEENDGSMIETLRQLLSGCFTSNVDSVITGCSSHETSLCGTATGDAQSTSQRRSNIVDIDDVSPGGSWPQARSVRIDDGAALSGYGGYSGLSIVK